MVPMLLKADHIFSRNKWRCLPMSPDVLDIIMFALGVICTGLNIFLQTVTVIIIIIIIIIALRVICTGLNGLCVHCCRGRSPNGPWYLHNGLHHHHHPSYDHHYDEDHHPRIMIGQWFWNQDNQNHCDAGHTRKLEGLAIWMAYRGCLMSYGSSYVDSSYKARVEEKKWFGMKIKLQRRMFGLNSEPKWEFFRP